MDKTIEVIVVAMVALVTGIAMLYLATGQAEGFGGFADSQQQGAQCSYYEERISRSCPEEAESLESQAPEECKPIQATARTARECGDEDSSDGTNDDSTTESSSGDTGFTQE
ncbi:MAG: hypothetical protein ACI8Z7_000070 [Candidatus Nanohaloarchaea archaeon]|jgi:hypothetical protein